MHSYNQRLCHDIYTEWIFSRANKKHFPGPVMHFFVMGQKKKKSPNSTLKRKAMKL